MIRTSTLLLVTLVAAAVALVLGAAASARRLLLVGLALAVIALAVIAGCGASFGGPATSTAGLKCGDMCECPLGCCNLAQIDCSGVACMPAGSDHACETTTDDPYLWGPNPIAPGVFAGRRDAGARAGVHNHLHCRVDAGAPAWCDAGR